MTLNSNSTVKDIKKYLSDEFGIVPPKKATKSDLIDILSENGVSLADVTEDAPAASDGKEPRKYEIEIMHEDGGVDPVPVGVNGKVIAIKRGERVVIEAKFFKVLEMAVKKIGRQTDEGVQLISVPSYPMIVHEKLY